jgi:hypothetical protein
MYIVQFIFRLMRVVLLSTCCCLPLFGDSDALLLGWMSGVISVKNGGGGQGWRANCTVVIEGETHQVGEKLELFFKLSLNGQKP